MQASEIQKAADCAAARTDGTDHELQDFLVFLLGEDACCIDFEKVGDVIACDADSEVKVNLAQIKSVADYHGTPMPVVDIRRSKAGAGADQSPFLVILQLKAGLAGIVVDGVSGVSRLAPRQISPIPKSPALFGYDYFKGLAFEGDRLLVIVDIECLMSYFNIELFDSAKAAA